MSKRTTGEKSPIDSQKVKNFFQNRAKSSLDLDPAVAMLYQDSNPELALSRDAYEERELLSIVSPTSQDVVFDVGCGVGRWAMKLAGRVGHYIGVDPIDSFVESAQKNCSALTGTSFSFYVCEAERVRSCDEIKDIPKSSLVLLTGVLHYLNDEAVIKTLSSLDSFMADEGRIVIRTPVGISSRLTLNDIWSEDLNDHYSAIYRTPEEYVDIFTDIFDPSLFEITHNAPLYPSHLNNRKETQQHLFIITKK